MRALRSRIVSRGVIGTPAVLPSRRVCNAQLGSQICEAGVRGPQRAPLYQRRSQQMGVDPSDSPSTELAGLDELHDIRVGHGASPMDLGIRREHPGTRPSAVTDQELALDEIVAQYLVIRQEPVQCTGVRCSPGQKPDPDRGIDQDHYATRRLRAGLSRRRGVACAVGSDPRNARRRSYAARRRSASSPRRTASVSVVAPLTARASASSFSSM